MIVIVIVAVIATATATATVFGGCHKSPARPSSPPPLGTLALTPITTSSPAARRVTAAQSMLQRNNQSPPAWVTLARAFIDLAREQTDNGLYAQARDAVDRALSLDANDLPALQTRAMILLADHRFADAEDLGRLLTARAPDDATNFAITGDAQIERGHYQDALASYQRMIDLSPGQSSSSRVAWLRWLTGDVDGALDMMREAVDAGGPDDAEGWAWCTAELGRLLLLTGKPDEALAQAKLSLTHLPAFAPALLLQGRALAALDRREPAIAALQQAVANSPTVEALWSLEDALARAGRTSDAAAVRARIEQLGERTDPRTFALWLTTRDRDPERALRLALAEKTTRDDVYTEDVLAWALYRNRRFPDARAASQKARALGTRDARMLFHAGAIERALGAEPEARKLLRAALETNPRFDDTDAALARTWLQPRR